jgi:RNA ligase (TIGR02306 family)
VSSLIVEVCKVDKIVRHGNADNLEIAVIKGWECIVKKGQYKKGDTVVYIPPDSLLPEDLADRLGVRNYLVGKKKNRVKCAKLRGIISSGLIINNEENWTVGTDVASHYGILKYEPPVRTTVGDTAPEDPHFHKFTEIENIKNYPDIFKEGEMVYVTEKVDGCFRVDQKVMRANGEESKISEIEKGDIVLSYDENKKEFVNSEVEDVIVSKNDKNWIRLFFDNGRNVVCTEDHLFLTSNRGWVEAIDIEEEDNVLNFSEII